MNPKLSWSKDQFSALRQETDPLADQVVKTIIQNDDLQGINTLFSQLRENDDVSEIDFPPVVKQYFEETSVLPDWADQKKIALGQQVFAAHGPEISLCLLCKSLPEAYACANGAKVLYATGRMTERSGDLAIFTRRLMETAQFVINVGSPGGLDPKGKGIVTAQKVRLIHASIRFYIKKHSWSVEDYGEPINQMDMAGTLQSFSTLILQGLETLKIELSEEEKDGYYHCWRIVGHIIGLREDLAPETYQEGLALGEAILQDQMNASAEGEALTKAVCDFMEGMLPGNLFKHAPETIIRFLIGDEIASCLGLKEEKVLLSNVLPRLLEGAFHLDTEVQERSQLYSKIISRVNQHLLQSMLNHFNEHKKVKFYIPPGLMKNWKLE